MRLASADVVLFFNPFEQHCTPTEHASLLRLVRAAAVVSFVDTRPHAIDRGFCLTRRHYLGLGCC